MLFKKKDNVILLGRNIEKLECRCLVVRAFTKNKKMALIFKERLQKKILSVVKLKHKG